MSEVGQLAPLLVSPILDGAMRKPVLAVEVLAIEVSRLQRDVGGSAAGRVCTCRCIQ